MTDDTNAELAFYPPQPIGRIDPDNYRCPSCHELQDVREINDDMWVALPHHKPDCLRAHRRRTDPNAN